MVFGSGGISQWRIEMQIWSSKKHRCSADGSASAGSQRQIQLYVNRHSGMLQRVISDAVGTPLVIRWVSPVHTDRYREYRDSAFLKVLGLSGHCHGLRQFWPTRGPRWDALGIIESGSGGVLLLEAKSHVPELFGNGCRAVAASSIRRINESIRAAQNWLHAKPQVDWKGHLYQYANRIAHLYFLREVLGIDAWLANVYFTGDPHSPTSKAEWQEAIAEVKKLLGVGDVPFTASVLLQAEPNSSAPCGRPIPAPTFTSANR